MCAILGYIANDLQGAKIAKSNLTRLLIESDARGGDATGIAFVDNNHLYCVKQPINAKQFVASTEYQDLINSHTPYALIGHTRLKTQGEISNNSNNHPILTKTGLALVHNGSISNDFHLFNSLNIPRDGDVDSEIIIKLIERYHFRKENPYPLLQSAQIATKQLRGSLAYAFISINEPRSIYIVRDSNPIVLAYDKLNKIIYFASLRSYLETALAYKKSYYGVFEESKPNKNILYYDVPIDKGYKLTTKAITPFDVETATYTAPNNYSHTAYRPPSNSHKLSNNKKATKIIKFREPFDPFDPIAKPSKYTQEQLEERLEAIYELHENQAYSGKNKKERQADKEKLIQEENRILNTLSDRLKLLSKKVDN